MDGLNLSGCLQGLVDAANSKSIGLLGTNDVMIGFIGNDLVFWSTNLRTRCYYRCFVGGVLTSSCVVSSSWFKRVVPIVEVSKKAEFKINSQLELVLDDEGVLPVPVNMTKRVPYNLETSWVPHSLNGSVIDASDFHKFIKENPKSRVSFAAHGEIIRLRKEEILPALGILKTFVGADAAARIFLYKGAKVIEFSVVFDSQNIYRALVWE